MPLTAHNLYPQVFHTILDEKNDIKNSNENGNDGFLPVPQPVAHQMDNLRDVKEEQKNLVDKMGE